MYKFMDIGKLKSTIKISDLFIGEGIQLKKIGDNYILRCINPKHTDTNPSMSVNNEFGIFKCFSCGIGGDVIDALRYLKPNLFGFKERVLYLNDNYTNGSINSFSSLQAEYKKKEDIKDNKHYNKVMSYIVDYCVSKLGDDIKEKYLLSDKEIKYGYDLSEVMKGYYLNDEIIGNFNIGYMPNSKELYNLLIQKYDVELIKSIGVFDNIGMPLFRNRLIIPYKVNGNIQYLISRKTENTPLNRYEKAKYKNQAISNNYIYNEDDLNNLCVFITEGPFDCLAIKKLGYDSVALSGIGISKDSIQKLIDNLKDSYLVYIVFDNEISRRGNERAQELNDKLRKNNINSFIITLPLEAGKDKIDVNEYLSNNSKEEFNLLLDF